MSTNAAYDGAWTAGALDDLADLIADPAPDVVALQECPAPEKMAELADKLGRAHYCAPSRTGFHTGLLWSPGIKALDPVGDKYAHLDGGIGTWHGFSSVTLRGAGWPSPITFLSCHLAPHDVVRAEGEARFLQSRLRRHGWPGVLLGDVNHSPLVGPEPDWDKGPVQDRPHPPVQTDVVGPVGVDDGP